MNTLQQRITTLTHERDAVRALLDDALAAVSEMRARGTPPSSEAEGLRELLDEARAALTESHAREARLREALQSVLPYVATQPTPCNGWKCRESWCISCFGEDAAEEGAAKGAAAAKESYTALSDTSATEWLRGLLEEVAAAARNAGQNEADHLKVQPVPTDDTIIDDVLRGAL